MFVEWSGLSSTTPWFSPLQTLLTSRTSLPSCTVWFLDLPSFYFTFAPPSRFFLGSFLPETPFRLLRLLLTLSSGEILFLSSPPYDEDPSDVTPLWSRLFFSLDLFQELGRGNILCFFSWALPGVGSVPFVFIFSAFPGYSRELFMHEICYFKVRNIAEVLTAEILRVTSAGFRFWSGAIRLRDFLVSKDADLKSCWPDDMIFFVGLPFLFCSSPPNFFDETSVTFIPPLHFLKPFLWTFL